MTDSFHVQIIELKRFLLAKEIREIIVLLGGYSRRVHCSKEQTRRARNIVQQIKTPFRDTLHSIIAKDNNAIVITRDEDFIKLKNIVQSRYPQDAFNL